MTIQASESRLVFSFWLGPQQYGLEVGAVREVVRVAALVDLIGALPMLCGLLNLRGTYLPVLSGRVLVGEPPRYELDDTIIIVGGAQPQLGLLVDQVSEVAAYAPSAHTPIQRGVADPLLDYLIGGEQGAIIVLSAAALIALAAESQPVVGEDQLTS
jgi:chemotaxis signal transduction protein